MLAVSTLATEKKNGISCSMIHPTDVNYEIKDVKRNCMKVKTQFIKTKGVDAEHGICDKKKKKECHAENKNKWV